MAERLTFVTSAITFADNVDESARVLRGLAVPYGPVSSPKPMGHGPVLPHRFERGAFARSIAERGSKIRLLVGHDQARLPIGRATGFSDDPDGLRVEFEFAETPSGDEALKLIRDGYVQALSVGTSSIRWHEEGGTYVHTESRLHEVSLANEGAFAEAGFLASSGDDECRGLAPRVARLRLRLMERTLQ